MKLLNMITLILVIVGGVNWGLVGVFGFDLVAAILGQGSLLAGAVYTLVGLSALWQVVPLVAMFQTDESSVQLGHSAQ